MHQQEMDRLYILQGLSPDLLVIQQATSGKQQ